RRMAMAVRSLPSRTTPASDTPDSAMSRPSAYAPDATLPRRRAASSVAVTAPVTTSGAMVTSVHTSTSRPRRPTSERNPRPAIAGGGAAARGAVAATGAPTGGAVGPAAEEAEQPRLQLDARDDRPAWCGGARVLAGGGDPSGHVLRSNAGGPPTVPPRPLRRGASRPCRRPRRSRAGRHRVHR